MSNSYCSLSTIIGATAAECALISEILVAIDLADEDAEKQSAFLSGASQAFDDIIKETDPDDPLRSFVKLFAMNDDINPGAAIVVREDAHEIEIYGDNANPENIVTVLGMTLSQSLPIGLEWSFHSDKLRFNEFGGGAAIISKAETTWFSTRCFIDAQVQRLKTAAG
jgi:hypothetical protein